MEYLAQPRIPAGVDEREWIVTRPILGLAPSGARLTAVQNGSRRFSHHITERIDRLTQRNPLDNEIRAKESPIGLRSSIIIELAGRPFVRPSPNDAV
jgi:hypothetical protein